MFFGSKPTLENELAEIQARSTYDTDLNREFHIQKFDTPLNMAQTIIGGAVASVVDAGASIWNTMPGTPEVQTSEILGRISEDALQVYSENQDAIELISLVGGSFIPGGIALKGMKAAREGSKAVNWFTKAGKDKNLSELEDMFRMGKQTTTEYKDKLRGFYGRGLANEALDAVAMEAAILGTMGAHPLLEDYWDDPAKNLVLSLGFGAVLGGGIGHIADRFAVNAMGGAIEKKAFDNVLNGLKSVPTNMTAGAALQVTQTNIESLQNIIKAGEKAGKNFTNDIEMQIAETALKQVQQQQFEIFDAASPGMTNLSKEAKEEFLKRFSSDTAFWGMDKARVLSDKEAVGKGISFVKASSSDEPAFTRQITRRNGKVEDVPIDAVYHPEFGIFTTVKQASAYAGAATLGKTADQLAKELGFAFGKTPRLDYDLEIIAKSTAEVQGQFIGAFKRIEKMEPDDLAKLVVAENDIPTLQAIYFRLAKEDPSVLAKVKIKIADTSPRNQRVMAQHKSVALTEDGRPIDYASYVKQIETEQGLRKYDLRNRNSSLDGEAQSVINDWIGGDLNRMRRMAAEYFNRKGFGASNVKMEEARVFARIYESDESVALREFFRKIADADGNVLLYRGWKVPASEIRGQSVLSSYAVNPGKAGAFAEGRGSTNLYRVHVDDIVAGVTDIGDAGKSNTEIIVAAGARPVEAVLDSKGRANFLTQKSPETVVAQQDNPTVAFGDIRDMLLAAKEKQAMAMFAAGTPLHTIAQKLDLPLDTVEGLAIAGESLEDLAYSRGMAFAKIKGNDSIEETLSDKNKSLVLSGNMNKNQFATARANLDKRTLDTANELMTESLLRSSGNPFAIELADMAFKTRKLTRDTIRAQLGWVNQSSAGAAIFNSFDFFARNMKDLGPAASAIGKEVEKIYNKAINQVVEPLSEQMGKIAQDPVGVIEFNTFVQFNSGLKGKRTYKDRMLMIPEEQIVNGKKTIVDVPFKIPGTNQPYKVVNDEVDKLLQAMQVQSKTLLSLANASRKVLGAPDVNDIGLWIPSFNPIGKFIAYEHDIVTDKVRMIWGNTESELATMVKSREELIARDGLLRSVKIYTPAQKAMWSRMNGRLDSIQMERADIGMQKGGSATNVLTRANLDVFSEIAGGYEHYIISQIRNIADVTFSDITSQLQRLSDITQASFASQPLTKVQKAVQKPSDPAMIVRNTLLGNSNLGEYKGWETVNTAFTMGLSYGANAVGKIWDTVAGPVIGVAGRGKEKLFGLAGKEVDITDIRKVDYEKLAKDMEEAGVYNPYAAFDDEAAKMFNLARIEDSKDTSKRIVYGSNALAATTILRFGELAQPLVNMLSLPILTSLAVANKMPESFMGVKMKTSEVGVVQVMMEGARLMNSPKMQALSKKWEELGYYDAMVSEATNVYRATRQFDKGAVAAIENALDSAIVNVMSKPADFSEAITRKYTMHAGYGLAKRLYPELTDEGATIFARDFMDKAIGNYHASQRPVMFQGTLGVALGLFQTYILTLGQSAYRALELKNYKALGKAALAQGGIFGFASMPGFEMISQSIGEHFSEDNIDLTTGTYRALPDKMADIILYGMPSNLGPSVYSRGDIGIRPPNVLAGAQNTVAVSFVQQTMDMFATFKNVMASDNPDLARAFGQAVSIQSMSRPLARTAEIVTGYSITREGNTVQTPEEVWTPVGIMARLLSTRPFEETKLRQAQYLNSFYGSADYESRQKLMSQLKTALRGDTLTEERLAEFYEGYLSKGGSVQGWRAALNEAIARTDLSGKAHLIEKMKPDSPLHFMINNLE